MPRKAPVFRGIFCAKLSPAAHSPQPPHPGKTAQPIVHTPVRRGFPDAPFYRNHRTRAHPYNLPILHCVIANQAQPGVAICSPAVHVSEAACLGRIRTAPRVGDGQIRPEQNRASTGRFCSKFRGICHFAREMPVTAGCVIGSAHGSAPTAGTGGSCGCAGSAEVAAACTAGMLIPTFPHHIFPCNP